MSDYTIRVKNLPNDAEFGGKEEILKARLWAHFEQLLVQKRATLPTNHQRSIHKQDPDGDLEEVRDEASA